MTLQAVFLDVGGTLVHEVPSRFTIYAEAARELGAELTDDAMQALMRRAHAEVPQRADGAFRYSDPWFRVYIRKIFQGYLGFGDAELEPIRAQLFGRFEDRRTFRLYEGAFELIDGLRERGLVVGVISNWSARLPRVLEAVGLAERLDLVLCSATEELEKPEPAIFQAALARAGVPAERALHAGDHPVNDGAARHVGLEAVLVDHGGAGLASDLPQVDGLPALLRYVAERLETA